MPASEKAMARLYCTIITIPVTATGRMSSVCTTDSSYPRCRRVIMYTHVTGTMIASAPSMDRPATIA